MEDSWLAGSSGTGKVTRDMLGNCRKICSGSSTSERSDESGRLLVLLGALPEADLDGWKEPATPWTGLSACVWQRLENNLEKGWFDRLKVQLGRRFGVHGEMTPRHCDTRCL